MNQKPVALVTGGNRGLGLGCCKELARRGYQVILTARNAEQGKKLAQELKVDFYPLDMTKDEDIKTLIAFLEKNYGRLDVLINNAGILLDRHEKATRHSLTETIDTNTIGPYLLCEAVGPLMKSQKKGRIVNVSSQMGQLGSMGADFPSYRISKAGLNAVTKIFASQYKPFNILVNSVCPGWVKTDMGGSGAQLEIEEGIDTILWAAELPDGSPTGHFFQKRQSIAW